MGIEGAGGESKKCFMCMKQATFFFFFEEKGIKSKALRAFNNEGIFFLLYMDY